MLPDVNNNATVGVTPYKSHCQSLILIPLGPAEEIPLFHLALNHNALRNAFLAGLDEWLTHRPNNVQLVERLVACCQSHLEVVPVNSDAVSKSYLKEQVAWLEEIFALILPIEDSGSASLHLACLRQQVRRNGRHVRLVTLLTYLEEMICGMLYSHDATKEALTPACKAYTTLLSVVTVLTPVKEQAVELLQTASQPPPGLPHLQLLQSQQVGFGASVVAIAGRINESREELKVYQETLCRWSACVVHFEHTAIFYTGVARPTVLDKHASRVRAYRNSDLIHQSFEGLVKQQTQTQTLQPPHRHQHHHLHPQQQTQQTSLTSPSQSRADSISTVSFEEEQEAEEEEERRHESEEMSTQTGQTREEEAEEEVEEAKEGEQEAEEEEYQEESDGSEQTIVLDVARFSREAMDWNAEQSEVHLLPSTKRSASTSSPPVSHYQDSAETSMASSTRPKDAPLLGESQRHPAAPPGTTERRKSRQETAAGAETTIRSRELGDPARVKDAPASFVSRRNSTLSGRRYDSTYNRPLTLSVVFSRCTEEEDEEVEEEVEVEKNDPTENGSEEGTLGPEKSTSCELTTVGAFKLKDDSVIQIMLTGGCIVKHKQMLIEMQRYLLLEEASTFTAGEKVREYLKARETPPFKVLTLSEHEDEGETLRRDSGGRVYSQQEEWTSLRQPKEVEVEAADGGASMDNSSVFLRTPQGVEIPYLQRKSTSDSGRSRMGEKRGSSSDELRSRTSVPAARMPKCSSIIHHQGGGTMPATVSRFSLRRRAELHEMVFCSQCLERRRTVWSKQRSLRQEEAEKFLVQKSIYRHRAQSRALSTVTHPSVIPAATAMEAIEMGPARVLVTSARREDGSAVAHILTEFPLEPASSEGPKNLKLIFDVVMPEETP